jgi:hypothetical protein
LTELIYPLNAALTELKGKSEDEVEAIVRNTLDNIIGTEPDALIGPSDAALLRISIPIPAVGDAAFEQISDILIGVLADRIAAAVAK